MALGKENLKKIKNLCRGPSLALGKGDLCRGPGQWPSAKKILKIKNLCRGSNLAHSKGDLCRGLGQWPSAKKILKKNLCRVPDGGHSAKTDASGRRDPSGHICRGLGKDLFCRGSFLCRGPIFAESSWGWPSANRAFAECPRSSPRQTQKPSAKDGFPVVIGSGS